MESTFLVSLGPIVVSCKSESSSQVSDKNMSNLSNLPSYDQVNVDIQGWIFVGSGPWWVPPDIDNAYNYHYHRTTLQYVFVHIDGVGVTVE